MRSDPVSIPYRSIACGAYDVLEAATVRKRPVRLELSGGTFAEGQILDVFARGKEEFCRLQPVKNAPVLELRLDSIMEIIDLVDGSRTVTQPC